MIDMKRLFRNSDDSKIFGVCSGIANYLGVDPTLVRVVAVILLFISAGLAIPAYLVIAVIMPEKPKKIV